MHITGKPHHSTLDEPSLEEKSAENEHEQTPERTKELENDREQTLQQTIGR